MTMRARRPRPIPEKAVQHQIVQLLRARGAAVYVLGTRRPRGDFHGTCQTPGIADLYCVLPAPPLGGGAPTGLWIEVKATGGTLRPEQVVFRDLCRRAGIPHVTGGVEEVLRFLVTGGWVSAASVPHYRQPQIEREEAHDVRNG